MTEVNAPPATIVEFLMARLDEDEADGRSLDYLQTGEFLLADASAKRAILEDYKSSLDNRRAHPDDLASAGALLALHGAINHLASVYADHPGYREEWTRP